MSSDIMIEEILEIPAALQSGSVIAAEVEGKLRLSLRVKSKDRTAIAKELGVTLPAKIGATAKKSGYLSACLGPDEWIIIADHSKHPNLYETALKLSSKYIMSVTDVSSRNVGLVLTGTTVTETINVGCPLDLSLDAFPVGKCTRTLFESAPILLYRSAEQSFTVEFWRSYTPYVMGLMESHISGA